ncbi:hypothetical protein ARMSODRAFT_988855 [Armillaria solidipes]|uniref:Uncharacterized protein n=1 Tax=Armillaria solidipes TaxID=1076256 RepID=A0A2H3BMC6_9AGAR|nr:hypothetical protein ARMSODRAFT_988855 [Armillaria solidipes]
MFRDSMKYAPERIVLDRHCEVEVINEMWTASWWQELQQILPPGATICPIILSSDRTQLSQFRGDKSPWPVYLTIGNITKSTRREASSHATVLIGYLPVGKFDCYSDSAKQFARYRVFHHLKEAGKTGITMTCSDELKRWIWPIVAAYVADYPEQCLVACCKENRCPLCQVGRNERGDNNPCLPRDTGQTLDMIQQHLSGMSDANFAKDWENSGIRAVPNPFWHDLPFSNIFEAFTPDLLHQLHKGVFKDHLVKWCTNLVGEDEIDEWFKAMPGHPGLRHFKTGLSSISQWTGAEYKAMEQVFLAIVAEAKVDKRVVIAVRSTLDFIYFTSLHSHTSHMLASLSHALNELHRVKDIFIETGEREHFNIPKFHAMQHYVTLIRRFGSADGFNTESPEHLHIDYAKEAYRASNRRDYTIQMTRWLSRQEAVDKFSTYLDWCQAGKYDMNDNGSVNLLLPGLTIPSASMMPAAITPAFNQASPSSHLPTRMFQVSKRHPVDLQGIRASKIIQGHNAPRFLEALEAYLRQHGSMLHPQTFDTFNLYRRLTMELPPIPEASRKKYTNVIRAYPPVKARGHRPAQPAQLDFTLVRTGEHNNRTQGTPLEGLRMAHVRVLFALPELFGVPAKTPLAYIDWFTPFATPDAVTGMHTLSRSTRMGRVYGEVIEVDRIVRNCHLKPRYSRVKDPAWTTEMVKDLCSKFYFNPYVDYHMFCMLKANKKLFL